MDHAIFGLTLLGIAFFHHRALLVATTGLLAVAFLQIALSPFPSGTAAYEIVHHFVGEWVTLANLLLLLLGFAVLSNQFERSHLPEAIPSRLPDGWAGGLVLLALVFLLSIAFWPGSFRRLTPVVLAASSATPPQR
jgi:hypothetical protein